MLHSYRRHTGADVQSEEKFREIVLLESSYDAYLNPFLVTFVAQEQTELERMVQELGGVLVQQKNEPQIFVATSVQSSEYKARPHDARDHSH
jgi:hypothetical protein